MPRRSLDAVADSREATLADAVQLASVVGLEGLTIGRLADRLGMSKSGLVGRFGSKEELQLATLDHAAALFRATVWDPAAGAAPGRARLDAICDAWAAYLADPPFAGGCFLTTAMVEFDNRPGPVKDAVRTIMRRWLRVLESEAATAGLADPEDAAFALNALAVGANCAVQLGDAAAPQRARRAMAVVLAA